MPSRYSTTRKEDRIKDEIYSTVKHHQEISQKNLIETVRKKLNPKPDPKTIMTRIRVMCHDGKLQEIRDRSSKKRVIGYVTPNYPMDEIVYEQMKDNFKKIHAMFDKIEKDSNQYTYSLMVDVKNILESVLLRIPESIKDNKRYLELQLESMELDISEDVNSTVKLLDTSNKRYQELGRIIHSIRTELCKLDNQRVKHLKQQQNTASTAKRKKIEKMIDRISDIFEYRYSNLRDIRNTIKSKNSYNTYENLIKKYPQNEPSNVEKICKMLDGYPSELQFKLENPIQKIKSKYCLSTERLKTLDSEFEEEENEDMLDNIEEEMNLEKTKVKECGTLLDKICRCMESKMSIKQILAEIPKEYAVES